MLEHFKGFISYTDEEFTEIWDEAIIVVDTNILLNFYKYTTKQPTKSLLSILKKLKEDKRLWIPHQVALEYFFNYENNMIKKKEGYQLLKKELEKVEQEAKKSLDRVNSTHPYINTEDFSFIFEDLVKSNNKANEIIDSEIDSLPDLRYIHTEILELMADTVGDPYNQSQIDSIERDGKRRYSNHVPPGYKDLKNKSIHGSRSYGGFVYERIYGDLILWRQMIDKAKEDSKPVIFITQDDKEDWWEIKKGETRGPQPSLIQEFFNETTQNFYIYNTVSFIKFASKELNIDVNDDELSEVTAELESIKTAEENIKPKLNIEKVWKSHGYEDDRNYIDFLYKSNISINEILEYLPQHESEQGKMLISNTLSHNNEGFDINDAIFDITYKALPYLEQTAYDLLTEITISGNANLSNEFENEINSLPKSAVDRGVTLIKLIKEMEFYINTIGL
ncbi:hypothetical protein K6L05_03640 [Salinicoccus roseus]|uniref:PIN-like domain-containing protein n=1 Tax=Salinicoccus roseus TaxID=45670 RepID=UPI001CA78AF3|nr:PIN-like domain-containing protein [Salinicoccus roseus]MBY8908877.1 hypothetical protein [Salinicoccus roseus]